MQHNLVASSSFFLNLHKIGGGVQVGGYQNNNNNASKAKQ